MQQHVLHAFGRCRKACAWLVVADIYDKGGATDARTRPRSASNAGHVLALPPPLPASLKQWMRTQDFPDEVGPAITPHQDAWARVKLLPRRDRSRALLLTTTTSSVVLTPLGISRTPTN
jgi:hypothetical protein